jgi:uroporphyrinogen decarboxylase
MNKIERVDTVLKGGQVDRPPVSLWYHFGIQHSSGEQFAKTTLEYFNRYDFDFLKVMNDYFYPAPTGLDAITTKEDLKRLTVVDVEQSDWKAQFRALEIIAAGLNGKAYFIDTVFDPWQSIKRNMAGENMNHLMENEPEALLEALEVVTDNLIAYSRKSLSIGSAGIFLSVLADTVLVTREQFLRFIKPFSVRLLEAISGQGPMTTAHIHGEEFHFDDVLDFPAPILNWWDRGPTGPSLQYAKDRFAGCVMGGIDQKIVARRTRAFLKNHVREGIELGGERRFLLANGCSIDTWVYPGAVDAIISAAREPL